MPIATEIDDSGRRICFTINGQIDAPEMMQALDDALANVQGRGGYDVLSDNRGVTVPITPDQLKQLVGRLSESETFKGRRAAIVVSSDASYGMMRMLGSLVEPLNIDVRGFRDTESALAFLKSPRPA